MKMKEMISSKTLYFYPTTNLMFINLSNHNSSNWSEEQRMAAAKFGEIIDMDFPILTPTATSDEVSSLAERYAVEILSRPLSSSDAVHIMGEMTFTYALVKRLRQQGIKCLASTTQRIKQALPDGTFISEFRFQTFRPYE